MKLILWFWGTLFALSVCPPAFAQTVTLSATGVDRPQHSTTVPFEVINQADCRNDERIEVSLALSNFGGLALEAWAGTNDCRVDENREEDAQGCWQVAPGTTPEATVTLNIAVRDIISKRGPNTGTEDDCISDSGTEAAQSFTLYFILVDAGGLVPSGVAAESFAQWPPANEERASLDLVGPRAPTDVTAGAGEGLVVLSFDASGSTDLDGYRFYCDPPRGAAPGAPDADAGTGPDAGISGACTSTSLREGEIPDEAFFCGTTGPQAESGDATGLTNFVNYTVGVSAVDQVGNTGPLSNVVCVSPKPVVGFFEAYRAAGGTAGGGFCAFSRRAAPGALAVIAVAALGLLARRRNRS